MKSIAPTSAAGIVLARTGGFTLLEVLVSLVVLAIGLLGLAMLQTTGLRFNVNSYSRTQATYLAYDIAERMRANYPAFTAGNYDVLDKTAAGIIVASTDYTCNDTTAGCTCDNGTLCDNATLAKADLGQWYYRLDNLLPGAKDAANIGALSQRATITRNGNIATITIYWLEQDRNAGSTTNPQVVSRAWDVEIIQ